MGHSVILPFRLKVLSGYLIPILKINNATLILRCWRQKHIYIYCWRFFSTVLRNIPKSIGLSLSDEGSIFFLIVYPNCERNNRKICPYYKKIYWYISTKTILLPLSVNSQIGLSGVKIKLLTLCYIWLNRLWRTSYIYSMHLDILFRQITMFIKVRVVFVFEPQTL